MRCLSKSKILAYRQCPKRLWLEIHRRELRQDSTATQSSFDVGNQVGDIARRIYDPKGKGVLIDLQSEGFPTAFERTAELLSTSQPIFEAGFSAGGALAFADVLKPTRKGGKRTWRMIEVKSSTRVKAYHRDDVAIQAYIARTAGVAISSVVLAHLDSSWAYPGEDNYQGLLVENDLTDDAFGRESEVREWIVEAQTIANKRKEPKINTGCHCDDPYECGFLSYCQSQEPQPEFPVSWLPRVQAKKLNDFIEDNGVTDLRDVPDELLNERQRRVKKHTLSGIAFFDAAGAATDLAPHKLPAYFLDFETIQFAVPIWKGTRPYQQIPFQFSMHRISRTKKLEKNSFLDLSGADPSKAFVEALIEACGERGPIFVYNAVFETTRINELANSFTRFKRPLLAINKRIVDLLRIAEERYYHPNQHGSWSIKKVLPAAIPDLSYDDLEGVQDGGMAMCAYLEAIAPGTPKVRKDQISQQLTNYCDLDTFAMVRLWEFFQSISN
jgi:hypothetical protein